MCVDVYETLSKKIVKNRNSKGGCMRVSVHLKETSQVIEVSKNATNTYTKGGFYCILINNDLVHKYPIVNIFRVIESYK